MRDTLNRSGTKNRLRKALMVKLARGPHTNVDFSAKKPQYGMWDNAKDIGKGLWNFTKANPGTMALEGGLMATSLIPVGGWGVRGATAAKSAHTLNNIRKYINAQRVITKGGKGISGAKKLDATRKLDAAKKIETAAQASKAKNVGILKDKFVPKVRGDHANTALWGSTKLNKVKEVGRVGLNASLPPTAVASTKNIYNRGVQNMSVPKPNQSMVAPPKPTNMSVAPPKAPKPFTPRSSGGSSYGSQKTNMGQQYIPPKRGQGGSTY